MRGSNSSEYVALPSSSELETDEPINRHDSRRNVRHTDRNSKLVFWACVGAILSSALSFAIFLQSTTSFTSFESGLRRPNQYMNLDQVLRNVAFVADPILNFPQVVLQFSASDPLRKTSEDERGWFSREGSVYPDDRHIVISPETSTIVQFRNLDFRMERCTLMATTPQQTETFDPTLKLHDPSELDVWVLDSPDELSPRNPKTWARAPKRHTHFARLVFSAGGNSSSREFFCPSGEFTTFELTCPPGVSNCQVDFWQSQRAIPRGGVHMVQSYLAPG